MILLLILTLVIFTMRWVLFLPLGDQFKGHAKALIQKEVVEPGQWFSPMC